MYPSLLVAAAVLFAAPALPSEELDILQRRAAIRTIVLSMETDLEFAFEGTRNDFTSRIWCDGDRIREDRMFSGGHHPAREIRCFDGANLIYWQTDVVPNVKGVAVTRWIGDQADAQRRTSHGHSPRNPRLLGLQIGPTTVLTDKTVSEATTLIGYPDRHGQRIAPIRFQNHDAREITFETSDGANVRIVIDPAQGDNAVLLEARWSSPNIAGSLEVDYAYHRAAKLWFPKKLVMRSKHDGKPDINEDDTIVVEEINQPVDPAVFTLAGMDIPAGTLIASYPRSPKSVYWDGTKEVVGKPSSALDLAENDSRARLWISRIGIVLCIAAAAYGLWMFMRK